MEDNEKRPLLGLELSELKTLVRNAGLPSFTAKQLADWVYVKGVRNFDEMTNLSVKTRTLLASEFVVGITDTVDQQRSKDGTVKYLFRTEKGNFIETVFIPDGERATLCVSSQVGCKMHCAFCMTGRQGFSGNLTAGDILNQIYALSERSKLTNVVFMGQGEPMDNLDQVLKACRILTDGYGMAWSPKRITVSTVGLRSGLQRFLEESDCHLAISLHHSSDSGRETLVPAQKAYPATEMVELLKKYDFSHQRRLSFEYIMFDGVNDSMTNARELVNLLHGLTCRINLIRFHSIPDTPLHGVNEARMECFRDYLTSHGIFTTIRASRGEDIFAACGLLSTARQQEMSSKSVQEGKKNPS
jgi:23S rRNA (adenine2503-C2)-methyltransferase